MHITCLYSFSSPSPTLPPPFNLLPIWERSTSIIPIIYLLFWFLSMIWVSYVRETIQCLSLCAWFISFTTMVSKCIHFVTNDFNLCFFMRVALYYKIEKFVIQYFYNRAALVNPSVSFCLERDLAGSRMLTLIFNPILCLLHQELLLCWSVCCFWDKIPDIMWFKTEKFHFGSVSEVSVHSPLVLR